MCRSVLIALLVASVAVPVAARADDTKKTEHSKKRKHKDAESTSTETQPAALDEVPPPLPEVPPPGQHVAPAAAPAPAVAVVAVPVSPVAAKPAPAVPAAEPTGPQLWLQPLVGGGWLIDNDSPNTAPFLRLGLAGEIQPTRRIPLSVFARFDASLSHTTYLTEGFTDTGGLASATVSEQRYDVAAGASYAISLASGRVQLIPRLAVRMMLLQNELFPANVGGIEPGGTVRVQLDPALSVEVRGGYTYNLFFTHATEPAVFGRPLALGSYGGGVGYQLSGTTSVRLDYDGDVLTREHSYRFYNTFTVGLRRSIL